LCTGEVLPLDKSLLMGGFSGSIFIVSSTYL
jgi:hypothetical protein